MNTTKKIKEKEQKRRQVIKVRQSGNQKSNKYHKKHERKKQKRRQTAPACKSSIWAAKILLAAIAEKIIAETQDSENNKYYKNIQKKAPAT